MIPKDAVRKIQNCRFIGVLLNRLWYGYGIMAVVLVVNLVPSFWKRFSQRIAHLYDFLSILMLIRESYSLQEEL